MRDAHRCDQGSSAERGKERWKIKAEIFAKKEVEVALVGRLVRFVTHSHSVCAQPHTGTHMEASIYNHNCIPYVYVFHLHIIET